MDEKARAELRQADSNERAAARMRRYRARRRGAIFADPVTRNRQTLVGLPEQGSTGTSDRENHPLRTLINGGSRSAGKGCGICRAEHITWTRPEGFGYCHDFRLPTEHYHETYAQLRACRGAA